MPIKPNTICKNPNCTKGEDGGRKHYYTCYSCIKNVSWHTVACCFECYQEYLQAIEKNRTKDQVMKPQRTDMTEKEVDNVIRNMSKDEAIKKSKEELEEYADEIKQGGISLAVDTANKDLDKQKKITSKKKTRKNKLGR